MQPTNRISEFNKLLNNTLTYYDDAPVRYSDGTYHDSYHDSYRDSYVDYYVDHYEDER